MWPENKPRSRGTFAAMPDVLIEMADRYNHVGLPAQKET
ncbi:hypothetical protein EVAR_103922_1, partial [Eumeta japonica]